MGRMHSMLLFPPSCRSCSTPSVLKPTTRTPSPHSRLPPMSPPPSRLPQHPPLTLLPLSTLLHLRLPSHPSTLPPPPPPSLSPSSSSLLHRHHHALPASLPPPPVPHSLHLPPTPSSARSERWCQPSTRHLRVTLQAQGHAHPSQARPVLGMQLTVGMEWRLRE